MLSRRTRKFFRWTIRVVFSVVAIVVISAIIFSFRCRNSVLAFQPSTYSQQHPQQAAGIANYSRPEEDTFYSYPEWYIVWSYQAKADFQRSHLPSSYPYFSDIAQYWSNYCCIFAVARKKYPVAWPEHVMLVVIGTSFSVEYMLKGAYEHSVGRLSAWTSKSQMTAEDRYAAEIAGDYATFVHIRPFYEYSFARALRGLWTQVPRRGDHWFRKAERRAWLTTDYAIEAIYCELIELATHASYGYEDTTTSAWVTAPSPSAVSAIAHVRVVKDIGEGNYIVEMPRYQEFTLRALEASHSGVQFMQIAGNRNILVSIVGKGPVTPAPDSELLRLDLIPSEPGKFRAALLCRVTDLSSLLLSFEKQGVGVEHIYDF